MSRYAVTLRQLDPSVSRAGIDLPEVNLTDIESIRLKELVAKLIELAPKCEYPLSPEVRIRGETGAYLLKANHGQLRFESWSSNVNVANPTVELVLSTIEGEPVEEARPEKRRVAITPQRAYRWKLGFLITAIVAANGVTVWQLLAPTPPPTSLVPVTTPLPEELALESLRRFAGTYATGSAPGDRVLVIADSGDVKWQTLGPKGQVTEEQMIKVRAVESNGERGLMADNYGLITQTDGGAGVMYFGDKYRRRDAASIK